MQEGRRGMVTLEGKLVVRVPAGQQAGHARPDSAVPLEEPVTLLVIAYTKGQRGYWLAYHCCRLHISTQHYYATNFSEKSQNQNFLN